MKSWGDIWQGFWPQVQNNYFAEHRLVAASERINLFAILWINLLEHLTEEKSKFLENSYWKSLLILPFHRP